MRLVRRMTAARIAAALTGGSVLACQGGKPSAGAAVAPAAPSASTSACSVSMGGPPGAIADPNGPYYHAVAIAHTVDGVRLTGARVVLDHASVPDGVARSAGDALVYYVNGATGYTWVGQTSDGTALNPLGPITLNGATNPDGVVDPDAFRLPDGRIRLACLAGLAAPSNTPRAPSAWPIPPTA